MPHPTGLVLAPIHGLRYAPQVGLLAKLTAPPYDVIDDEALGRYEAAHPANVVRLTLPRGADSGPESRYARAAAQLDEWRTDGTLIADPQPALYVYEMRDGEHVQRGLLGALGLVPPEAGIVLPHENTMSGIVADRLALTTATRADLEAIFLVYDGGGAASAAVSAVDQAPPLAEFASEDGVEHRLWSITDPTTLAAIAADLHPRRAMIADGHHRYANFLGHQNERHAAGDRPGPWDYGFALLVDATTFGPQVHAIHRVVPGLPLAKALEGLGGAFGERRRVTGNETAALDALAVAGKSGNAFVLSDGGGERWLVADLDSAVAATELPADRSAAWRSLDVTVLHHVVVRALWGRTDDETTVWYRHDVAAAERAAADSGGTAVLLNPTPIDAVVAVAAAGERMPRKSTYFSPKPRTGLVIREHR